MKNFFKSGKTLAGAVAVMLVAVIMVVAGDMDPPPEAWQNGNPVSTMKDMNQLEPRTPISSLPYVITNSGSYYVTANLMGTMTNNGITIYTNDVILDLGGFTLKGAPASNSYSGITVSNGPYKNITVRNGVLRGWGDCGQKDPRST